MDLPFALAESGERSLGERTSGRAAQGEAYGEAHGELHGGGGIDAMGAAVDGGAGGGRGGGAVATSWSCTRGVERLLPSRGVERVLEPSRGVESVLDPSRGVESVLDPSRGVDGALQNGSELRELLDSRSAVSAASAGVGFSTFQRLSRKLFSICDAPCRARVKGGRAPSAARSQPGCVLRKKVSWALG